MQQRNFDESLQHMPFGVYLKVLRNRHGIKQGAVLAQLPDTWTQPMYSDIERDRIAPSFQDLEPIYLALYQAGVRLAIQDRISFLQLARERLEGKRTHRVQEPPEAWEALGKKLARIDGRPDNVMDGFLTASFSKKSIGQAPRYEVGHLVGRAGWLGSIREMITRQSPIKVIVVQGSPGSGKTSEIHRIANHFLRHIPRYHVVLSEPSPIQLGRLEPIDILECLLGDIIRTSFALATMPTTSLQARINYVLDMLAKADRPVVISLDNAEHIFDATGDLAAIWQRFLTQFVQANHRATLLLASQEWPANAFLVESQLMTAIEVPALTAEEGCQLLQILGLRNVSGELLGRVVKAVGGTPLCLEWVVRLAREPYLRNEWAEFEEADDSAILAGLLDDPALFGGVVARRIQTLLDRVLRRLSSEAMAALQDLAVAGLPLGAPALKMLYQSPRMLRELREASLLVAYPQRVQLLPPVAAQIRQQLTNAQVDVAVDRLIAALSHWLNQGISSTNERGVVFTELACFLLRCHRFLDAAELILYHGWLSSHVGQMLRLARIFQLPGYGAQQLIEDEMDTEACGKVLLHFYLAPYLGEEIDGPIRANAYERILSSISVGKVRVEPLMHVHLVEHIMRDKMEKGQFQEAQQLFEVCFSQLEPLFLGDFELHATVLSKKAMLYSQWSAFQAAKPTGEAQELRDQVIAIYRTCLALLERALLGTQEGTLLQSTFRKKQATFFNNLAYQLNIVKQYDEALNAIDACIALKKQGYAERDSLAASYGEKSQILAALGRFQDALVYDQLARDEIRRCAETGDAESQTEFWIYQVNQGYLYFLLGRIDEAETLLLEAEQNVSQRRNIYRMMAQKTLNQIQQWKAAAPTSHYQLDWPWVKRYRDLSAYDAYWWWAHAGPFTEDEKQQWEKLFLPHSSTETKAELKRLLLQSRDRELEAALIEGREPRLHYPAIEIDNIRRRIADFLDLDAEIEEREANAIVRHLYHGAIEDELLFLRMIEASYDGKSGVFWELTQKLYPLPSYEEMQYALEQMRLITLQGLQKKETREISHLVIQKLLQITTVPLDFSLPSAPVQRVQRGFSSQPLRTISAQAAMRFFQSLLRESGYDRWRVELDPNVSGPRIEPGLRRMFLPDSPLSLEDVQEYLLHEILGHVTRSVAGETSRLGLLGIGTKGYMVTEEGIADYHERYVATQQGQAFDDSGSWIGTLAIGLAGGILTKPQTFFQLFSFLKPFLLLYRLLWRDDEDLSTAEQRAQQHAINRCLRVFRGVPDLTTGICFTKDVVYLRGYLQIARVAAEDISILDRLSVGKVALDLLPALEELGIPFPQEALALRKYVYDANLAERILSFGDTGNAH